MKLFHKEMDAQMDKKHYDDFFDPKASEKKRKGALRLFLISLVLLIVLSTVNWGVISSWGKVNIERVYTTGADGAEWSALVYVPKNATNKTPAPAVIMFHGNAGNARNHESWAVEFSRRGFVVVVPDMNGSGDAMYTDAQKKENHLEPDYWYRYMLSLDIVDKNNILATGHSAGTTQAWDLGSKYNAKGIMAAAGISPFSGHYAVPDGIFDPGNPTGEKREIKITDWNRAWYEYTGNCVICMGYTEMDNYAGENEPELFLTWGLPILNKYPGCENVEVIEPNKVYGDFASGHGFVFNMEDYRIHEAAFVSQITIGNLLKYGQISVDEVPNFIDSTDQVWMYKDYIGLFACLAFAFCLFNLAVLLAEYVPALSKAKRPVGRNVGARGIEMVIVIIIGILGPLVAMKTDAFGIVGGPSGAGLTKLGFHLKYSNLGFGVIIGCGIFAIAGFILFMVAMAKKGDKLSLSDLGLAPADYDITASFGTKLKAVLSQFAPSLLIALIVIVSGFTYMKVMLDVCGTDFYCWFFGIKNIPLAKLPAMIPYIVVFMLLHIIIGVDINVIRRYPTTGNETLDTVIAVVLNMLIAAGMVIIVVAVKWHLQSSDQWAVDSNFIWKMGMDTQRIWGMPLGMGIASGGTTYLYKKTGNIWLCACLVGLLGGIMCTLYGQYQFDFNAFPSWV